MGKASLPSCPYKNKILHEHEGRLARGHPFEPRRQKAWGKAMGRKQKYTKRFEIRCSADELLLWRYKANDAELSLSDYVRACLEKVEITRNKYKVDPALLRHLSAIGNNINQLTYWANTYKSKQEANDIKNGLSNIEDKIAKLIDMEENSNAN